MPTLTVWLKLVLVCFCLIILAWIMAKSSLKYLSQGIYDSLDTKISNLNKCISPHSKLPGVNWATEL